jgi:hypothetical protein
LTDLANCFIIRRLRLIILAFCLVIPSASPQTREVVALARSEAPFLTGGSDAPGEGNVFEGESLHSYYLPVWIDYRDGARYALGVGSAARLSGERIELQGVSLEIVSPGPNRGPSSPRVHLSTLKRLPGDCLSRQQRHGHGTGSEGRL